MLNKKAKAIQAAWDKLRPVNSDGKRRAVCEGCSGSGRIWQYFRKEKTDKKGKVHPAGYVTILKGSVYAARKRGDVVEEARCPACAGAGTVIKGKPPKPTKNGGKLGGGR